MRLTAALLCDSATVRESLLHVLGGGVTVVASSAFPAPFGVDMALLLELDSDEPDLSHSVAVTAFDEQGQQVFRLAGELRRPVTDEGMKPLVPTVNFPLTVPMSLHPVDRPGLYRIVVSLDERQDRTLWLRMVDSSSS
ncbi:DUF6941 family protein [Blastococcus capsensis]|uniref:DUF6941 family protein n=1 Tax=Blastococcus capsensis TaxID=1564163 RepID=UPI003D6C661D